MWMMSHEANGWPVVSWPQILYLLTPVVVAASSVTVALTVAVLAAASRLGGVRDLLAAR